MKLRILGVLALLILRTDTTSAQQAPAIFPFEPAQLIAVLPAAPADWKVLRSEAGITLGEWLETRASRTFEAPPAANGAEASATPGAPGKIDLIVVDTAGFAPAMTAFANFAPSRIGNVEKKLVGSLPAIVTSNENGRVFAEVLVSARYLVQITLTNLPRQRVEDWLRGFHFDALPTANRTPTRQVREFRLTQIDELEPKNNRSYVVATTSAKRMDDFLKKLPAEVPRTSGAEQVSNQSR